MYVEGTRLPVDILQRNLQRAGRDLRDAVCLALEWRGAELGIIATWQDGATAWLGMGPIASAMVEARTAGPVH